MPVVKDLPILLKPYAKLRGKKRKLVGVFVGGCVERGDGSSFRRVAHAHCSTKDPYKGWICIRAARRLAEEDLLRHELAHILTGLGHNDKFYAKFVELGGTLEKDQAYINREAFRKRQQARASSSSDTTGLAELLRIF